MRLSLRRGLILFSAILLTIFILASCSEKNESGYPDGESGQQEEGNNSNELDESEEPTKISMMLPLHTAEVPEDKILNEIEKTANVQLDIDWVPNNTYEDKLNTAFATGTLPQVFLVSAQQFDQFKEAIRDEQFWEIGPYLDEFKNLGKLKDEILENTKVNGKLYSLYQGRPLSRQGLIYRKDWADNLGLEEPTNLEEFYEMARAFTEDDPNSSGKDDTIGLTDRSDLIYGAFKTVASWHGTPNNWGEKDSELLPEFMFDEYMNTMKYMKELRDNGYINQDFPVTSKEDQSALFKNGTAGMYVGSMSDVLGTYDDAVELNPDIEYDVHNHIAGSSGEFTVWAIPGYGSVLLFPKSAIETEEELKDILAFYDKMMTPELANIAGLGIEGEHYIVEDGHSVIDDDQSKIESEVIPYNMLNIGEAETRGSYVSLYSYKPRKKAEQLIKDNENHLIHDPTITLESETFILDGDRLQTIIDDATYNYILGEIDEEGFYAEVEKWKEQGGNDIITEFNASR